MGVSSGLSSTSADNDYISSILQSAKGNNEGIYKSSFSHICHLNSKTKVFKLNYQFFPKFPYSKLRKVYVR